MTATATGQVVFLSTLIKHPVQDHTGRELGRLSDLIITVPGGSQAPVTGLLLAPGDRDVFVSADRIAAITSHHIELSSATVDLRPFVRRDGEVLLRADVLGHRLLEVDQARLVRAYDVALTDTGHGWAVTGVDIHRIGLWQRLTDHTSHQMRDWSLVEALIGHQATAAHRSPRSRLRGMKPAQIADLLEEATADEQQEILAQVHTDPELEADVFEELDDDRQARLLGSRTDTEIAAVLARMNADDAADALMDLPQHRRRPVLDALPEPARTEVTSLLGYGEQTAGGLMSTDYLTAPPDATANDALTAVRHANGKQPQALTGLFLVNENQRLIGAVSLVAVVQADPTAPLTQLAEPDPVRVTADTDPVHVTRLMADYNLLLLPVVDTDNRLIGVITVDDALEAAIPDDWRRRDPDAPLTHPN